MKKSHTFALLLFAVSLLSGCWEKPLPVEPGNGIGDSVPCTRDAKICPDGSTVGRVPPRCEFEECPMSNWKTFEDDAVSFKYPTDFGSDYVATQAWPPTIKINPGIYSCAGEARFVEDRDYCVTETSEGAAGSTYKTYQYLTNLGTEHAVIDFTLRLPQCANYPEAQREDCEVVQENIRVDELVDQIAKSIDTSPKMR